MWGNELFLGIDCPNCNADICEQGHFVLVKGNKFKRSCIKCKSKYLITPKFTPVEIKKYNKKLDKKRRNNK